ncbi:hypothetical protein [Blastopirellula marina]|uniref:Uncharacterized protein n=1 Tax=Blastopirellula marina TaxID=124 RepID=A0A2S8GN49_9BACT|nr:hypothetical protein [Blastopirellula marina]PQO45866.1 hypothetical protein C5Y93_11450 [Blastopirellula marina]
MTDSDFFIDDGYCEQGHIAALAGVHGPLDFVYRPMIHADKEAYYEQAKRPGVRPTVAIAHFVAQHLHQWSLSRPIVAAEVERLRPRLLERLFYIVMGEIASDLPGAAKGSDQEASDLKN